MKLIILKGPKGSGKSVSIEMTYKTLLNSTMRYVQDTSKPYYTKFAHDTNGVDFMDILISPKGIKTGVLSEGDYARKAKHNSVKNYLDYFEKEGCDIVLCAWKSTSVRIGQTFNKYSAKVFIPKKKPTPAENALAMRQILSQL